jgi:hypothetical protein
VKTLPVGEVALGSHMFVTIKHTETGVYDKAKARLVADGSQQDASLYPDKPSLWQCTDHILYLLCTQV